MDEKLEWSKVETLTKEQLRVFKIALLQAELNDWQECTCVTELGNRSVRRSNRWLAFAMRYLAKHGREV